MDFRVCIEQLLNPLEYKMTRFCSVYLTMAPASTYLHMPIFHVFYSPTVVHVAAHCDAEGTHVRVVMDVCQGFYVSSVLPNARQLSAAGSAPWRAAGHWLSLVKQPPSLPEFFGAARGLGNNATPSMPTKGMASQFQTTALDL